jgi:hypothetical protein
MSREILVEPFDLTTYLGRIAYLSTLGAAERYLEIGVQLGNTFFNVPLPIKVAVDPNFLFDPAERQGDGAYYFSLPSNDFFSMLQSQNHGIERALPFDIIFIDGLHTLEQSLMDFANSLNYAHDNTLWLIDDTVPCDAYSALPDMDTALVKRYRAGLQDGSWHGDVFKTVFAIHDLCPEISYCTLVSGNPQTILWRSKGNKRKPAFSSLQEISSLNYYDMFGKAGLMMPVADERLRSLIGLGLDPARDADPLSWQMLITCPDLFFKIAQQDFIERNSDIFS